MLPIIIHQFLMGDRTNLACKLFFSAGAGGLAMQDYLHNKAAVVTKCLLSQFV